MTEQASGSLARVLSPFEVVLLTLSALSPVLSVFIGGNAVLHMAGTGAALAFLLGGLFNACFCLLYAEIGAAFPGAGGVYPALSRLLGPRWSFAYIMLSVPASFCLVAFSALGLAAYVHALAPALPVIGVAVAGIALAGAISILAIKRNALITGLFLAVELVALLMLTGVALVHMNAVPGDILAHPVMLAQNQLVATPPITLALATIAGVWSTAGGSWALYFAEEMQDVQQKIGRVVAGVGVISAVAIAVPLALVVLAIDDVPNILRSEAPIAAFLAQSAGPLVGTVMIVGVVAAIFNAIIATIMCQSRLLYATGRDGAFFGPVNRLFAFVHPRQQTPIGAVLALIIIASALTLLGEQRLLILISGNVSDYFMVGLAVWAGRRTGQTGQYFKAPLHPLVPLIGMLAGAGAIYADWADVAAGRPSIILLLGLFVAAALFYGWRRRQLGHDIVMSGSGGG